MNRREAITVLGGAAAGWPLVARAQQVAMPVIGILDTRSLEAVADRLRGFRQGLKDIGYVEGENVAILYRFAENQVDRLPGLAADLVRRNVAVIATAGDDVALVAKAATVTVPIVFIASQDPVRLGLVASLARPGGNTTGINFFQSELAAKRLEILRELVPKAARVAVLVNPSNVVMESTLSELMVASRAMNLQIEFFKASTRQEIDVTFASFVREQPDALFVSTDTFFSSRRVQLVNLASRHGIPTGFPNREAAEIGGLMSYGSNIPNVWRQAGAYAGRILKGAKPMDLPVVQSSNFELVINAQTARMLGITVPQTLLTGADEVIE